MPDEPPPTPAAEIVEATPVAPIVIVDAGERALRDEEARKQAELMARQARDVAEKKKRSTKSKKDRRTGACCSRSRWLQTRRPLRSVRPSKAKNPK